MHADKSAPTPHARLREYRAKRRFDVTPEPSGDAAAKVSSQPQFVIQKHAASHLHYDFRLEHAGVLLSWSVPKGPSLSPTTRRLAMRTEDHPLDYADFEGVIPEGQYGGGTVIVWDRGTWTADGDVDQQLAKGRLTFELVGEKLRGRWHLVKTQRQGSKEAWLLFKGRDSEASDTRDIVAERPESAVTGRSIDEVGAARDRVWHSNRAEKSHGKTRSVSKATQRAPDAAPAAAPGDLKALVSQLPLGFALSNLDKVLYPEAGVTKAALIAYLTVVHEWMLPHLARRPLTLVRHPDGHHKKGFYQKHRKPGTPDAVKSVPIAEDDGTTSTYMFVEDLAGIVGLAQLGTLEIHTWGAHVDKVERPDLVVLDLDPDPSLGWDSVVQGAIAVRDRLDELGLQSWVKTTGGKGLHVVAPVERRIEWDELKAFTKAVTDQMADKHPTLYTTNPLKARRKGKIFLDYLRNGRGATFITPYSPRSRPGAPVATPISWTELEAGLDPSVFTLESVPRRLASLEQDPWADIGQTKQSITARARRQVGA